MSIERNQPLPVQRSKVLLEAFVSNVHYFVPFVTIFDNILSSLVLKFIKYSREIEKSIFRMTFVVPSVDKTHIRMICFVIDVRLLSFMMEIEMSKQCVCVYCTR